MIRGKKLHTARKSESLKKNTGSVMLRGMIVKRLMRRGKHKYHLITVTNIQQFLQKSTNYFKKNLKCRFDIKLPAFGKAGSH
jgi:hypothetical protein